MAIYHLSVKTFRRASGQSATAAAAYRSGSLIRDRRTGQIHDYRKKEGVESSEIIAPAGVPEWAKDRELLWNRAEESEKRKNSVVAREFEIALPSELTKEQRRELAIKFAKELVARHGFAADICIHKPSREGDQRNHHAHILVTTRRIGREGFAEKTRELDEKINRGPREFEHWRERFATLTNEALERHRHPSRVDHRTLLAQGIERAPTQHLGPRATAIERKMGEFSRTTQERDQQLQELEQARLAREQAERAREQEQRQREKERQEKAAQEKAKQQREQATKAQELAEKRRLELLQELTKSAPKAVEPTRTPTRVSAWRGPTSKPASQRAPSIEPQPKETSPTRKEHDQEQLSRVQEQAEQRRQEREQQERAQEERRVREAAEREEKAELERAEKDAQERAFATYQARKESEEREAARAHAEQRASARKETLKNREEILARTQESSEKRREEREPERKTASKPPEYPRNLEEVKPTTPLPPRILEKTEPEPKKKEEKRERLARGEIHALPAQETESEKKERVAAFMRERVARLKQMERQTPEVAQQEPTKPPLDKEQLRQQMRERAAELKPKEPEPIPAPKVPEQVKLKEKDKGPER